MDSKSNSRSWPIPGTEGLNLPKLFARITQDIIDLRLEVNNTIGYVDPNPVDRIDIDRS